ncbi:MAG TPA: hypothetical protein VL418_13835 [Devosiaceae bacterium]|jgi:hypothetical protein|nr:hypothetical protein [Devosiaceae bacterium]
MPKFITLASLAFAAIGLATISSGTAFAATCLNPASVTPLSLTHDDMAPNRGAGYDRMGVQEELALGNRCGLSPDYNVADYDTLRSHPNEMHSPTHQPHHHSSHSHR